jgi:hypothetical protein
MTKASRYSIFSAGSPEGLMALTPPSSPRGDGHISNDERVQALSVWWGEAELA